MKNKRQQEICNIIRTYEIDTQTALASMLKMRGFDVAQTTVSRDIKDLQLVKVPTESGTYRYTLPDAASARPGEQAEIFEKHIVRVQPGDGLVIIRTVAAAATIVAQAMDCMGDKRILGTVAGYDTVFVAVSDKATGAELAKEFSVFAARDRQ
ncbi:MAG: arginine repressor [Clostridia bacterium]|nr:arginine repressor [Clostridia bacterium]